MQKLPGRKNKFFRIGLRVTGRKKAGWLFKLFSMKVTTKLITQLKEGNLLAFKSVYQLYSSHIYNFIYSLLCSNLEAEDLTQEVFVRLWERKESLDIDKNFDSYLFSIARNLVYDQWSFYFHADNYVRTLQENARTEAHMEPEEKLIAGSIGEYIDWLIEKLPRSRREIFLLSRKQHLTTREIARRMSISERTVETQIYRSLQFLREHLTKEGILLYFLLLRVNEL